MTIRFGCSDVKKGVFWRALAAEFVGCSFYVLCVTCANIQWPSQQQQQNYSSNLEIGMGIGLSVTCLTHALWHVSGGHLNPAVSVAMVIGGRMAVLKGFMYIIAQAAGGKIFLRNIIMKIFPIFEDC